MTSLSAHCCKVGAKSRKETAKALVGEHRLLEAAPKEVLQAGCWCDRKGREWTLGSRRAGSLLSRLRILVHPHRGLAHRSLS